MMEARNVVENATTQDIWTLNVAHHVAVARCDQAGHADEDCENDMVCILCQSTSHCSAECNFKWAKPKITMNENKIESSHDEEDLNVQVQQTTNKEKDDHWLD